MPEFAIPSHDVRIEQAVLGSMILSPETCYHALSDFGLKSTHFYRLQNQGVFDAIRACYEEGEHSATFDITLIARRLSAWNRLADVGGWDYLTDLFNVIPTGANLAHYVKHLIALYERRRLEAVSLQAAELARNGDAAAARSLLLDTATAPSGRDTLTHAGLQVDQTVAELEDEARNGVVGIPTPFKRLDKIIGGFVNGRTYVLAGLTSMGKTSLALQCVAEAAMFLRRQEKRVVVWSKEMHYRDVRRRLLALLSGVPLPPLAFKRLPPDGREAVYEAAKLLKDLPIDIDDRPTTLDEMILQARSLRGRVGMFVLDHARLVNVPNAASEYQAVTRVSWATKQHFAVECEVPCLVLSQFNRAAAESGGGKTHELRGSGALEEDADLVMRIYRKAYGDPKSKDPSAELSILKNRHGFCGLVELDHQPHLTRFVEKVVTPPNG